MPSFCRKCCGQPSACSMSSTFSVAILNGTCSFHTAITVKNYGSRVLLI